MFSILGKKKEKRVSIVEIKRLTRWEALNKDLDRVSIAVVD
jgi:hypothetical protein